MPVVAGRRDERDVSGPLVHEAHDEVDHAVDQHLEVYRPGVGRQPVAETMDEIDRLYTDGPVTRTLFQNLALQKRLTEAARFDATSPKSSAPLSSAW